MGPGKQRFTGNSKTEQWEDGGEAGAGAGEASGDGQRRRDISWEALGGVHAGHKIGLAGQDKDTCPQPNLVLCPAVPAPPLRVGAKPFLGLTGLTWFWLCPLLNCLLLSSNFYMAFACQRGLVKWPLVPALGVLRQQDSPSRQSSEMSDLGAGITKTEPQLAPKPVFPEPLRGVDGVAFSATFSARPISSDQFTFL